MQESVVVPSYRRMHMAALIGFSIFVGFCAVTIFQAVSQHPQPARQMQQTATQSALATWFMLVIVSCFLSGEFPRRGWIGELGSASHLWRVPFIGRRRCALNACSRHAGKCVRR